MRRMGALGRALAARTTIYSHIAGAHHCEVGHTGRFFCRQLAWSPRAQSRHQRQWANWQGLTRASAVRGQVWGCQSYTATTTHMAATLATALCIASLWRGATSVVSAAANVTIKISRIAIAFPYNDGM